MKKFLTLFLASYLLIFSAGLVASAATFNSGENLVLTEALIDDAYLASGNATIDENIDGDLYIVGGNVTINGDISEDLVVIGGWVNIFGNVGDDVRVLGGSVAIYGNVGDDVLAGGIKVDVTKSSTVGGSVILGSGFLTIDGNVMEDVRGIVGMLILNGIIEGDMVVTVEEKIDISEKAMIKGNLKYSAILEASISKDRVGGKIEFNKFERENFLEQLTFAYFLFQLISYASALLLALLMVLAAPKMLVKAADMTKASLLRTVGVGILSLIAAVVGSIVLLVTVVGIPLGLMILAMLLVVFYLTKIFVAAWLSNYFFNYSKKKKHLRLKMFFGIALALLAYYLIGLIPYVGWLIDIVLFLVGMGTIVLTEIEYFKFLKSKKMV